MPAADGEPLICMKCGRRTASASALTRHQKAHCPFRQMSGIAKPKCQFCSGSMSRRDAVRRHERKCNARFPISGASRSSVHSGWHCRQPDVHNPNSIYLPSGSKFPTATGPCFDPSWGFTGWVSYQANANRPTAISPGQIPGHPFVPQGPYARDQCPFGEMGPYTAHPSLVEDNTPSQSSSDPLAVYCTGDSDHFWMI